MVIEIAKDDLMPPQRRRSDATAPMEPSLRRMRWGSLKSRSYDHAGDRRPPRYRMVPTESNHYASMDRREHSLPSRPSDYVGAPFRRVLVGDYGPPPVPSRSDYGTRGGAAAAAAPEEPYEMYPNERHYYGYSRDHRSREAAVDRDRRDYYVDERDLPDRDRREFYEPDIPRDIRERDMRSYRESREPRDYREVRETARYSRELSAGSRREREYMEERDDQRMRDYRLA
ncbi:unnamed protein product [Gongylonema pulchrum]|uniref:RBM1CTR domain-containing protein n=1 Tax=Gongylonema pulchrum TaxID=637853 RepID=A0A183D2K9_9BILA|nr:unnamed protein product [Gongylonema pulchrum]